ncbi:MAG: LuxR C-terminal-related transcriptional regulator [Ktedonobacteraceae bacterium]
MPKSIAWRLTWNTDLARYQLQEQMGQERTVPEMDIERDEWPRWLERLSSFSFQSREGAQLTVRKEGRGRSGAYWIAYRRAGGKLKRMYLGASQDVTFARLEQVTAALTGPKTPLPSPVSIARHEQSMLDQVLTTKFYLPTSSHALLPRPRLETLLAESVHYPLTLVSAPAGFGKTTLITTWLRSLPSDRPRVAWVSLDEQDNEPLHFWTYVLTALERSSPGRFTAFLTFLREQQSPPLQYVLATLINRLSEQDEQFLLVLDDYHVITEQAIHAQLSYLVEHLPSQMRLLLSTRTDPPLPLSRLRARSQVLGVGAAQLRCTQEEEDSFLRDVMGIELQASGIDAVMARTEGWLMGLQLLGLSLQERSNLPDALRDIGESGHSILDYLTEEVLKRLDESIQAFLLRTSILERLTAPLCDAVLGQQGSQQVLEQLERANLFVVSLDGQRRWFRYHALFAEALRERLLQVEGEQVSTFHLRASQWYAQHGQLPEAVRHALLAGEWPWAAELIEQAWRTTHNQRNYVVTVHHWLESLPVEEVYTHPRLCLAYANVLQPVARGETVGIWLRAAETALAAHPPPRREQADLPGRITAFRAMDAAFRGEGQTALALCQQALALLQDEDARERDSVMFTQAMAYMALGEFVPATALALESSALVQSIGRPVMASIRLNAAAGCLIIRGHLREAWDLLAQAVELCQTESSLPSPAASQPYALQARILREWNRLDEASDLARAAVQLGEQAENPYDVAFGSSALMSVSLSQGKLDVAVEAMNRAEQIFNQLGSDAHRHFLVVDQVRLWLARGESDRALCWAWAFEQHEREVWTGSLYTYEREQVALVRVLLSQQQSGAALERLTPLLAAATTNECWENVIEMRLLEALAHAMGQEEQAALSALAEAVRLGEPEGYIRRFVDEGPTMVMLLSRLREQRRRRGPKPYLDRVLAACAREGAGEKPLLHQGVQDSLSERELEVLRELAQGASNQEIAETLVLSIKTVKHHVSNMLAKLGAGNRTQAVAQARSLGLLSSEP